MSTTSDEHIERALSLADELILLADEAEAQELDDGCEVLCGVVRDCSYKIRSQAERERSEHENRTVCSHIGGSRSGGCGL